MSKIYRNKRILSRAFAGCVCERRSESSKRRSKAKGYRLRFGLLSFSLFLLQVFEMREMRCDESKLGVDIRMDCMLFGIKVCFHWYSGRTVFFSGARDEGASPNAVRFYKTAIDLGCSRLWGGARDKWHGKQPMWRFVLLSYHGDEIPENE